MPTIQAVKLNSVRTTQRPAVTAFGFLKLLTFSVGVVFALEGIFALGGIGEQEYLKPDKNIGFIGMEGKHVTWRSEGFSRSSFNSFGMHDKERSLEKPAGIERIAVVGDSFVEALQVDPAQNFCALTENALPQHEVLNFGASAYNLGQAYLRLKNQASAFKPDVVVLAIRPQAVFGLVPDVNGGFLAARPTFFLNGKSELSVDSALQEQWLKSKDGKRILSTSWLRKHSRIWGVVSIAMQDLSKGFNELFKPAVPAANPTATSAPTSASPAPKARSHEENEVVATNYYWPLAESLILLTRDECKRVGARLILLRLPASGICENETETALLAKTAQKHQIELIQTDAQFAEAAKHGERLFYDVHFAPAGHRLLSSLLLRHLKQSQTAPDRI